MTLLAHLLLGLSALLTCLVVLVVGEARRVAGADAMGLIVVPMLLAPRWLALAGAIGIAARRSALAWIHPARSAQAAVALAWHALAGAASFASVLQAHGPHSATFKPWAFVLAVVVPFVVTGAVAAALGGAPAHARSAGPWRIAAALVSLVVAAGGAAMWRVELADARRARLARDAEDAAGRQWRAERLRALAALSPEAPLREWLPWVEVPLDELRAPALAAVRARPELARDVEEMLRGDEAPQALRFMWLWMPGPPPSLAEPARVAIAGLPAWAERRLSDAPRPEATTRPDPSPDGFPPPVTVDLSDMAQAAIVIADAYRSSGLDFVGPIRELAAVLERHALPEERLGEDPTYQPRAYLRTWLDDARRSAGAPP